MRSHQRAGIIFLALVVWSGVARAETLPLSPFAPAFEPLRTAQYTLWRDKDGIHLRWADDGRRHLFEGTVKADGYITRLAGIGIKPRSGVSRTGPSAFTYTVESDGSRAGVDFHLIRAKDVSFDLFIDKQRATASAIRLEPNRRHPKTNPFDITLP